MRVGLGLLEFGIFLYLFYKASQKSENIINILIFNYVANVFNTKYFGSIPWLNVGVSLYPSDFVVITLLFFFIARRIPIRKNIPTLSIMIFLMLSLFSAIRGIMAFGLSSEFFSDLRTYLYFGITVLYFISLRTVFDWKKIERKLDTTFTVIALHTAILLVFHYAGIRVGFYADDRPLVADLAIPFVMYIAFRWYRDILLSKRGCLSIVTFAMTIILILNRYNTTWMALIGAIVALVLFRRIDNNDKKSYKFGLQIIAVVLIGVIVFPTVSGTSIFQELSSNFDKFDTTKETSFTTRIELWTAIMATYVGVYALIGYPFGNGYRVIWNGTAWKYTPHNGYIEMAGRMGWIGVGAIVLLLIWTFCIAFKRHKVLPIMMVMIMIIYWVAYSITLEQGVVLGMCIGYLLNGGTGNEYSDMG